MHQTYGFIAVFWTFCGLDNKANDNKFSIKNYFCVEIHMYQSWESETFYVLSILHRDI